MSNPRANFNGIRTRFNSKFKEPTEQLSFRIPVSITESIDELLDPGQSRSEWLRQHIIEIVERETKKLLVTDN
jgi:hypothetical protein